MARGRGDGPVLLVGGEHGAAALGIVREAAGREHDAPPRPDFDLARRRAQHGAAHGAAFLQQAHRRGGGAQIDAQIGGGAQQPPHQGETVAQLHPPPVQGEIDQVPTEATRDMERRRAASGSRS